MLDLALLHCVPVQMADVALLHCWPKQMLDVALFHCCSLVPLEWFSKRGNHTSAFGHLLLGQVYFSNFSLQNIWNLKKKVYFMFPRMMIRMSIGFVNYCQICPTLRSKQLPPPISIPPAFPPSLLHPFVDLISSSQCRCFFSQNTENPSSTPSHSCSSPFLPLFRNLFLLLQVSYSL